MTQHNVDVARAMYAELDDTYKKTEDLHRAHETGDFSSLMERARRNLHEDVVLKTPAESAFPDAALDERHGREEFLRFVLQQTEGFEEMFIRPAEFIDAGGKVLVPLRFGGRARHSGLEVSFDVVHVLTMDNGKGSRLDIYLSRDEALEAAGSGEG